MLIPQSSFEEIGVPALSLSFKKMKIEIPSSTLSRLMQKKIRLK